MRWKGWWGGLVELVELVELVRLVGLFLRKVGGWRLVEQGLISIIAIRG